MSVIIEVFYYTGPHTRTLLPSASLLLARLNPARRERFEQRVDGAQRALDLAALRVLEIAMRASGHDSFALADVIYPLTAGMSEKPFWKMGVDFSVSHARSMVACALVTGCRVGLDVEERRDLDPRIVRRIVNEQAALSLDLTEANAVGRWTQIEAVLKGAGLGVMHGREIDWGTEKIALRGSAWHVHPLECGSDHVGHLAVDVASAIVRATRLDAL